MERRARGAEGEGKDGFLNSPLEKDVLYYATSTPEAGVGPPEPTLKPRLEWKSFIWGSLQEAARGGGQGADVGCAPEGPRCGHPCWGPWSLRTPSSWARLWLRACDRTRGQSRKRPEGGARGKRAPEQPAPSWASPRWLRLDPPACSCLDHSFGAAWTTAWTTASGLPLHPSLHHLALLDQMTSCACMAPGPAG